MAEMDHGSRRIFRRERRLFETARCILLDIEEPMEEEGDLDQEGRRRLYTCAVYTIHQLWLLVPGVDDGVGGATNPVFPGEQAAAI
jgi:hypothetical protein